MSHGYKRQSDMKKERDKLNTRLRGLHHLINPVEVLDKDVTKKIQSAMKSIKEHDRHLYDDDPGCGNLLTKMCILLNDIQTSKDTNSQVLKKCPNNFTAKRLEIEILMLEKNMNQAKQCINALEEILTGIDKKEPIAEFEMCVHKADVAICFYHIGPKYYAQAIELYEEAVSQLELMTSNSGCVAPAIVEKYLVIWKFKLVHLYNRMLNHGNIKLFDESKKVTPVIIFHKMCIRVGQVLKSVHQHNTYRGRAYIEIMDAHQKLRGHAEKRTPDFIKNAIGQLKINDQWCIKRAYELAPDDGSVLEKVGRYYRIHAKCMKDLQMAAQILERCVELYPSRHVALHQLSQVYKSMWFDVNDFEEAKLHKNPIRTGKKFKKSRGARGGRRNNSDPYTMLAKDLGNLGVREAVHHNTRSDAAMYRYIDHTAGASWETPCRTGSDSDEGLVLDDDEGIECGSKSPISARLPPQQETCAQPNTSAQPLNFSQIKIRPTRPIQPKSAVPYGRIPSHFSKPDYFDILRTSNPLRGADTRDNHLLEQAIDALEKANQSTNETANRYLVDLARLYISHGDQTKAINYFAKADEKLDSVSYHDGAYLYEQWALSRDHSGATESELNDIKALYQEAVGYSIAAREKSKMAFYQLKDIIDSQLIDNPNERSLKTEKALLQKMVENFDRAKGKLREIFEEDPSNVELLWNLIDVLYKTDQYLEAFKYLKFAFPLQTPAEMKVMSKDMVDPVSVTIKAIQTIKNCKNYVCTDMIKSLFLALTKSDDFQDKSNNSILFYDDRDLSDYSRLLHDIFEEIGLCVVDSVNNAELLGKPAHIAYSAEMLKKANCVVVIADSLCEVTPNIEGSSDESDGVDQQSSPSGQRDTATSRAVDEMLLLHHLENEVKLFRPILVTYDTLSSEWNTLRRLKKSPTVSMKEVLDNRNDETTQSFTESFLRAVFDNIEVCDGDGSGLDKDE